MESRLERGVTLEIDSVDMKLLKMLTEDGRVSFSEMGEEVGLSTSGVRRRIKKLEEDRIIQGYTVKIDPEKAGYKVVAFLNIDVSSGEVGRVAGILSRCKGVCEVHRTTGDHSLIAKVRAEDLESIHEFVEERVSSYQGVKKVSTTMAMKTYKEDLLIP